MINRCRALLILGLFLFHHMNVAHGKDPIVPAVVALFGDSITVGQTLTFLASSGDGRINYGFPSIYLTSLLNNSQRPSVVPNWGIGGSPSGPSLDPGLTAFTNGLDRIINTLVATKNTHPGNVRYVLIMYGTNDFNWSIPPSITFEYTRLIIKRAKAQGFIPVIATLTPRADRSVSSYNSQIAAAASVEGAVLIDHYSAFNNAGGLSLLGDGVHPTTAGYNVIAQTWFNQYLANVIEPELDSLIITPIFNLLLDD